MGHPRRDQVQGWNVETVQNPPLERVDLVHPRARSPLGQADSNCCEYRGYSQVSLMEFKSSLLSFQFAALVLGSFFFGSTLALDHVNVQGCNATYH